MDVNDLRSAVTVVSLLLFIALMAWTWSTRRRSAFDEAQQLPFLDDADDFDNATPAAKGPRASGAQQ